MEVISSTISKTSEQKIWDLLETVCDPEVPVLSILDLGIVRNVEITAEAISIKITPTYSGCPAMDAIAFDIRLKLLENGYKNIKIISILSPAWTTDWMSEEGKKKLNDYGIAAPGKRVADGDDDIKVSCPQCKSTNTILLSQFASTACKSLYQCEDCREPFDHFKCH